MIRAGLMIGALVLAGLAEQNAQAQSSSLFGSSGPRAQSSSSSSSSRSTTSAASSAGMGTSGLGSSSGMSGGGRTGGGLGGQGAIQGPQLNQLGQLSSQAVGNGTGFVGQQNQGAFVGNRMAGAGQAAMMQPTFGAFGGGQGGSDFNSQNRSQGSSSTRAFRPRYRAGFDYRPQTADVQRRASVQADRLSSANPALAGLQISVSDVGVAEIRGQAPTQDARLLIENLVRLEPGVSEVTNLVEVVPLAPAAANPQ